jgi:hypothetical protein
MDQHDSIYPDALPENTKALFFIDGNPTSINLNGKNVDIAKPYLVLVAMTNSIELRF